jgi:hypothetical protein
MITTYNFTGIILFPLQIPNNGQNRTPVRAGDTGLLTVEFERHCYFDVLEFGDDRAQPGKQ